MRLLIWNIQSFTYSRMAGTKGMTAAEIGADAERTLANSMYIVTTVEQADPDVFVVIEARSNQGTIERLATGKGPTGLISLYSQLCEWTNAPWYLVPPIRVNPRDQLAQNTHTETVGVFWRNDRVQFTGPYVWPAASPNSGPPVPPGALTANYPAPWDQVVPANTTAAARCRFYKSNGTEIVFADPLNARAPYTRRPLLTTFRELGGMQRNVKLFSVHTKPGIQARDAMFQMIGMQPADWVPGNMEVTVFAGDFNLNLLAQSTMDSTALQEFNNNGLGLLTPAPQNGRGGRSRVYGRYDAQPGLYLRDELLDYGFIRYGTNARPQNPPQFYGVVIDRVAGVTPGYNLPAFDSDMAISLPNILNIQPFVVQVAGPPAGAVRAGGITTITTTANHGLSQGNVATVAGVSDNSFNGHFLVTSTPSDTTFTYAQNGGQNATSGNGTVNTELQLNRFRSRWNYGHISPPKAGTSDHLPVFMNF